MSEKADEHEIDQWASVEQFPEHLKKYMFHLRQFFLKKNHTNTF